MALVAKYGSKRSRRYSESSWPEISAHLPGRSNKGWACSIAVDTRD